MERGGSATKTATPRRHNKYGYGLAILGVHLTYDTNGRGLKNAGKVQGSWEKPGTFGVIVMDLME